MAFIDNQTGLMASVETFDPDRLRQAVLALRHIAGIYGLPVILTASDPSNPQGPGPVIPELTTAFPDSEVIARTAIGAWDDPGFVAAVEASKRRQLIVSGIATDAGVSFTALGAKRAGYEVFVVVDACASWSSAAHDSGLMRMTAAGIIPVSWIAVAAEIQRDWSHPNSEELAMLLQRNISRWGYIAAGDKPQQIR